MNTVDIVLGAYGVLLRGRNVSRATAARWAEEQVGHTLNSHLFPTAQPGGSYYVESVRLDDDQAEPTKGRVIATCSMVMRQSLQKVH